MSDAQSADSGTGRIVLKARVPGFTVKLGSDSNLRDGS